MAAYSQLLIMFPKDVGVFSRHLYNFWPQKWSARQDVICSSIKTLFNTKDNCCSCKVPLPGRFILSLSLQRLCFRCWKASFNITGTRRIELLFILLPRNRHCAKVSSRVSLLYVLLLRSLAKSFYSFHWDLHQSPSDTDIWGSVPASSDRYRKTNLNWLKMFSSFKQKFNYKFIW